MLQFVLVGLGGAVGAMGRYGLSLIPLKSDFPAITLLTNILGALLIGAVIGLAAAGDRPSANFLLFLRVGVCGGFTTFSTFSSDSLRLLENGRPLPAIVYICASVILCIAGVWLGKSGIRLVCGK